MPSKIWSQLVARACWRAAAAHGCEQLGLSHERRGESDELIKVAGDISGAAMLHGVLWSAARRDNGGNARRKRFEDHEAERIRFRRESEDIQVGERP